MNEGLQTGTKNNTHVGHLSADPSVIKGILKTIKP